MGLVSIYLYKNSKYDSNPVYKPIQVNIISPRNIPISCFNMLASINTMRNVETTSEREILSVNVLYDKFNLDSFSSNNRYAYTDNGIDFYPKLLVTIGVVMRL